MTRTRVFIGLLVWTICITLTSNTLLAESKHVLGIHFWDWGANVDVMSHRTGWVVESNVTGSGMPNVQGRYVPARAEGFTIIQRLDWDDNLQTMAVDYNDQVLFAQQCGSWANALKDYVHVYSIGNEMEFVNGMTPEIYARGFEMVYDAIKAVQPDAVVAIGHWNSEGNVHSVMQLLGPDGYDGLSAHVGSHIPVGLLGLLETENARPGVGVYITEWGWVADTNASSMSVMAQFANDIGQWNANNTRQVYSACWYLYPGFLGDTFSLQLADQHDNAAFTNATSLGVALNAYADNPVVVTNFYADVPDDGNSITLSWNTSVPTQRQLWWTPEGTWGWQHERFTDLVKTTSTTHQYTMTGLSPEIVYEVMPTSSADGYGDAGGRRYLVQTGPWSINATQTGPGRVTIEWTTPVPSTSKVEYGQTPDLGNTVFQSAYVTDHSINIFGLPWGEYYFRVLSAEDAESDATLYVRSPQRSFTLSPSCRGDFDEDNDVDQEDYGHLQACLTGAGIPQPDPACIPALIDDDEDVDADDVAIFYGCMTGANNACDPNCGLSGGL